MEKYLHFLRTGSGSNTIELQFEGDAAEVVIRQCWMGMGLKQFKLACRHHALSRSFGLLVVERVEASTGDNGPFEVIALDEEDMLLPLVLEYVRVSQSPVYVHGASDLATMRPLGYATWNDLFELVLMVHDFDGRAEKAPLVEICDVLDKKKFAAWTEEARAKQEASERADSDTAVQQWKAIFNAPRP